MLDATKQFSVIIPCLDVADTLAEQLDALAAQQATFCWEVIVVDNGSTDATVSIAESYGDRIDLTVIAEPKRGRHFACNAGAAEAQSPYLAFVDGDDVVQSGFVAAMREALNGYDMVAGIFVHDAFQGDGSMQHGPATSSALMSGYDFLPFASGGCTGIRKEAFDAVGGFDAEARFCEDTALSWNVQRAGFTLGPAPSAAVAVRQRSTYRTMFRQHRNFGQARVWLYREFKEAGMPRRPFRAALFDWLRIFRAVPFLGDTAVRIRWTRRLGRNIGFVKGSIVERQLFL